MPQIPGIRLERAQIGHEIAQHLGLCLEADVGRVPDARAPARPLIQVLNRHAHLHQHSICTSENLSAPQDALWFVYMRKTSVSLLLSRSATFSHACVPKTQQRRGVGLATHTLWPNCLTWPCSVRDSRAAARAWSRAASRERLSPAAWSSSCVRTITASCSARTSAALGRISASCCALCKPHRSQINHQACHIFASHLGAVLHGSRTPPGGLLRQVARTVMRP